MNWQQNRGDCMAAEPTFTCTCAKIKVAEVAKALKMDCQTVRLLLQNGLVDWGIAYKRGDSRQYSYLIYPKLFYEATGYICKGEGAE